MSNRRTGISPQVVEQVKSELEQHPVYAAVTTPARLTCFMQHHVYSVWDFMSLVKYLHATVPPVAVPWTPGHAQVRRFLNELLLEEETDSLEGLNGKEDDYLSHYEMYLLAMEEVGIDQTPVTAFVDTVTRDGIAKALQSADLPAPAISFMEQTFGFINGGKSHEVAAALALGREHIIPTMFRRILADLGVGEKDAPAFHFYLHRHIHLDEDHHGPMSLKLVDLLCEGDANKVKEAEQAAITAIRARITFWDGVYDALQKID